VDGVGVGRVQWRVVWPDDGGWDGRRVGWTAGGVDGGWGGRGAQRPVHTTRIPLSADWGLLSTVGRSPAGGVGGERSDVRALPMASRPGTRAVISEKMKELFELLKMTEDDELVRYCLADGSTSGAAGWCRGAGRWVESAKGWPSDDRREY